MRFKKTIQLLTIIVALLFTTSALAGDTRWEQGGMNTAEKAGAVGGGAAGMTGGAATGVYAVSTLGTVSGLSGPGIMSGLAAIGGTAVGGIVVLTCGVAIVTAGAGYGGYRLVKWWTTED